MLFFQGPADAEAVESHGGQVSAGRAAQVLVLSALDDSEQSLVGLVRAFLGQALVLRNAAQGPQTRALQRLLLITAGVVERGELVEGEHDVRAQVVLDLH